MCGRSPCLTRTDTLCPYTTFGRSRLDLVKVSRLDLEEPVLERFPALGVSKEVLREGGARPAILNAVNEIAVASFLDSRLAFLDIAKIAREALHHYDPPAPASLDDVLAIDAEARRRAQNLVGKFAI